MESILAVNVLDLITNLKQFMDQVIRDYHSWIYAILFLIIFCETGLVVAPFLPGDSLLFMAGSFAAAGTGGTSAPLDLAVLLPVLLAAPVCGDTCNYWIGRFIGPKVFHKEKVRFLNRKHLDEAHRFYERYGGWAVTIGRFAPIIRTCVPFVAGIGRMAYPRFLFFSAIGTMAWISICILSGFFFGNLEWVQKHFEALIIIIICISLIPAAIGFIKARRAGKRAQAIAVADPASDSVQD